MNRILIILALLSSASFAQEKDAWEIIRTKEAQGLDSLLCKKIDMQILAKYKPAKVSSYSYGFGMIKIENIDKWQHPATLYIFLDTAERICKLNYYFKDLVPPKIAESFIDYMNWSIPKRPHKNDHYLDSSRIHFRSSWDGFVLDDNEYSEVRRIFWERDKPMVKFIYSVGKILPLGIDPCTGEEVYDDIYEPQLFDPNIQMCGDSTVHY